MPRMSQKVDRQVGHPKPPEADPTVSRVVIEDKTKKRGKTIATVAVASALVGAGIGAWLTNRSGSYTASVGSGEVVRIVPETLDIRAEVVSDVESEVQYRSTNLTGKIVGAIGLGGCFGQAVKFTGLSGEGGGQLDSYITANAEGVRTKIVGKHQTVYIPSYDIGAITRPDFSKSELESNNGDCHDLGATGWKLLAFSKTSDRLQAGQGYIGSLAEQTAENYAQTSCDQNVWHDTEKAMTKAYQMIDQAQIEMARANGQNVANFDPKNISVVITGGLPHYQPAYDTQAQSGYHFVQSSMPRCEEAVGALQLGNNLESAR
jgi:hypothetical protein